MHDDPKKNRYKDVAIATMLCGLTTAIISFILEFTQPNHAYIVRLLAILMGLLALFLRQKWSQL